MCETDAALMRTATACHPVLSVLVQAGDLRQVSFLLAKTLPCVQILVSSGNAFSVQALWNCHRTAAWPRKPSRGSSSEWRRDG